MDEKRDPSKDQRPSWDATTDPSKDAPPPGNPSARPPSPTGGAGGRLDARGAEIPDDGEDRTQELPPGFFTANPNQIKKTRVAREKNRPWAIVISVLVVVAIVASAVYGVINTSRGQPALPFLPIVGCAADSPCGAADAYLEAYSGLDYETMFKYISAASQQRFSDPDILGDNFQNAHDYIITRTSSILAEAHVTSISASPGNVSQTNSTSATLPVRITMQSSYLGSITQDLTLPLVNEKGQWKVDWSPGLIFHQLDDPNGDPLYTRKVHLTVQDAKRGTIFDRDGNPLAQDLPADQIMVDPVKVTDSATLVATLSSTLDYTKAQIQDKLNGAKGGSLVLIRTITPQLYAQVKSKLDGLAGVQVQTTIERVYPYGADAAPVTGYIGSISQDELNADKDDYYIPTDKVGRAGVEQWGENVLRPTRGGALQVWNTNADGSLHDVAYTLAQRDAADGHDIHTTISIKFQQQTMGAIRSQQGSRGVGAILLDPKTGDVMALASNPIYDPNDFSLGFTPNEQARLSAMDHPYLNRALSSALPTGSVFKLITLSASLEGGIPADQIIVCTGTYQVPGEDHKRTDDLPQGHGKVTPVTALPPSCDVAYWQLAVELNGKDPNYLSDFARKMGYGAATGINGVPAGIENPGLVPDPAWLAQTQNGAKWTPTDAANLGIGQGAFIATPLQVAMITAAIANNGQRMQPRLVSSVTDSTGATTASYPTKSLGQLPITADHLSMLQGAMLNVTTETVGTSYSLFKGFPIAVAGKSGTAEVEGQDQPDGWFTAYAPASPLSGPAVAPQVAIAVGVPNTGLGAATAGPVTKAILAKFFNVG